MATKTCDNCNTTVKNIPFATHEIAVEHFRRIFNRMWVIIIILIALLFGSNAAWILYESQFETVETVEEIIIEADDGSNANYIGQDGNIYNGGENSN